jgi:hypothetical protein
LFIPPTVDYFFGCAWAMSSPNRTPDSGENLSRHHIKNAEGYSTVPVGMVDVICTIRDVGKSCDLLYAGGRKFRWLFGCFCHGKCLVTVRKIDHFLQFTPDVFTAPVDVRKRSTAI